MSNVDFKTLINTYIELIKTELPDFDSIRNQGATEGEIEKYEKLIGVDFPEELKELYEIINGDNKKVFGFIMGLNFYSIEEMYKEWLSWRDFDEDEELNDPQYYSSIIPDTVKCSYTNKGWLPIAHDCASNYYGIDLDPDIKGTTGQIINFGRDENDKMVFADSLKAFVELNIRSFDEMYVEHLDGDRFFITNKEDTHSIDWLKEKLC